MRSTNITIKIFASQDEYQKFEKERKRGWRQVLSIIIVFIEFCSITERNKLRNTCKCFESNWLFKKLLNFFAVSFQPADIGVCLFQTLTQCASFIRWIFLKEFFNFFQLFSIIHWSNSMFYKGTLEISWQFDEPLVWAKISLGVRSCDVPPVPPGQQQVLTVWSCSIEVDVLLPEIWTLKAQI